MTKLIKATILIGTMMVLVFHPNRIGLEGELTRAPKDDNQRITKKVREFKINNTAVL